MSSEAIKCVFVCVCSHCVKVKSQMRPGCFYRHKNTGTCVCVGGGGGAHIKMSLGIKMETDGTELSVLDLIICLD